MCPCQSAQAKQATLRCLSDMTQPRKPKQLTLRCLSDTQLLVSPHGPPHPPTPPLPRICLQPGQRRRLMPQTWPTACSWPSSNFSCLGASWSLWPQPWYVPRHGHVNVMHACVYVWRGACACIFSARVPLVRWCMHARVLIHACPGYW